jgi:alpha-tubulin suppressor-like RCC1 family protein
MVQPSALTPVVTKGDNCMYQSTKQLLKLFIFILLPVFMFGCGNDETTTASTFITGSSGVLSGTNSVRTWGANGLGQLGVGNQADSLEPKQVSFPNSLEAIAVGGGHMLVLDSSDRTIWAWGFNVSGQLGNSSNNISTTPVKVLKTAGSTTAFNDVKKIAAGIQHSLAIVGPDNEVWAWGLNDFGQLGDESTINRNIPVLVKKTENGTVIPLTGITEIAAGGDFSLALDVNGKVWAWGNNARGQLGVPLANTPPVDNKNIRTVAKQVTGFPDNTKITAIAAGVAHGLAMDSLNIWGWGYNAFGQAGQSVNLANPNIFEATKISALLEFGVPTAISGGSGHSLALIDGSVYAWGYNFYGQLGNNATLKSETPVLQPQKVVTDVNDTLLTGIKSLTAIGFHSIAIDKTDRVWTWGYNAFGQLGDGTRTDRSIAKQVVFP